jgi:hypothetical protein
METGKTTINTDMGLLFLLMETNIKETGLIIREKEKEHSFIQMVQYIKVSLKKTFLMVMESFIILPEIDMKANGIKVKKKEKESLFIQMVIDMKDNSTQITLMEKEYIITSMGIIMMEISAKEFNMEWGDIIL